MHKREIIKIQWKHLDKTIQKDLTYKENDLLNLEPNKINASYMKEFLNIDGETVMKLINHDVRWLEYFL